MAPALFGRLAYPPAEQQGGAAGAFAVISERRRPARRIGGDRAQELAQLLGAAGIEGTIGAARQPRHLPERARRDGIAAFMEDEERHTEEAELAGRATEGIDL